MGPDNVASGNLLTRYIELLNKFYDGNGLTEDDLDAASRTEYEDRDLIMHR